MRTAIRLIMTLTFSSAGATTVTVDRPRAAMDVALEALSPSTPAAVRDLVLDRRIEKIERADRFYRDSHTEGDAKSVAVALREALTAAEEGDEIKVHLRLDEVMRGVLRMYQLEGEEDPARAASLTSFLVVTLMLSTTVAGFSAMLVSLMTGNETMGDFGLGLGTAGSSLLLLFVGATMQSNPFLIPGTREVVRWWREDKLLRTFWRRLAERLAEDPGRTLGFTATRATPSKDSLRQFARLLHESFAPNLIASACETLLDDSPFTNLLDRITKHRINTTPLLRTPLEAP